MTTLSRLLAWYASQCNGDWEHQFGVKIETLDNPGWSVRIDLSETVLEDRKYEMFEDKDTHEKEWLRCWKADSQFQIACGPIRLEDALTLFLEWAEAPDTF